MNNFSIPISGMEYWLTKKQVSDYLSRIHINDSICYPDLVTLKRIIQQTYAIIPFQNLTMLTRPRIAPCPEQIVDDMLNGIGGLCTTINPFLCALFQHLGFHAGLFMVSLNSKENRHIAICVEVDGKQFWVDVGNGFPYLEPLEMKHNSVCSTSLFSYRLKNSGTVFQLEQTRLMWGALKFKEKESGSLVYKVNQTFEAKVFHYKEFSNMRKDHYSNLQYGPFLTGIRINRWEQQEGFMMRDSKIWTTSREGPEKLNLSQGVTWLCNNFQQANRLIPMLEKSWEMVINK